MTGRKRQPMSATEFMAQLQVDQEYQLRKETFDAQLQVRADALRSAEGPIVADLREAGFDVSSVWDLVNTAEPYASALPVLLEHLERGGSPDRVMESLGRALAVKPSVVFWERLKARYRSARGSGEQEGLAVALAACATPAQTDDLISFLAEEERGLSRVLFVRPILGVGGERGRRVVKALRSDPVLGSEATALLAGRA